jgi:hypothetical protein
MNTAHNSARLVLALVLMAIAQWPQPVAAFHVNSVSATVTSINSVTRQVNIDIVETTGPATGPISGAAVQWGDAMTSGNPWTFNGPGIHTVSASHTYPDLTTRTITVLGDCCGPGPTTQPIDTAQVDFGCKDTSMGGCHLGPKSQLQIKNNSDDNKDKFAWKWQKGDTTLPELGDPTTGTQYFVCIYAPGLVFEAIVPNGPPWVTAGSKGFKYKEDTGAAGGMTKMKLKSGMVDKAKILIKGKGLNLDDPLPLTQPVLVQLQASNGECWDHLFSSPEKENSADQFKDKEP